MYWAAPRAAPIRVQRGAVNRSSHAIGAAVLPLHSHNGIDFVHMYDVPNKFPWLFYELPVLKYILSFSFYCAFNNMKFDARLRKHERIRFVLFFLEEFIMKVHSLFGIIMKEILKYNLLSKFLASFYCLQ